MTSSPRSTTWPRPRWTAHPAADTPPRTPIAHSTPGPTRGRRPAGNGWRACGASWTPLVSSARGTEPVSAGPGEQPVVHRLVDRLDPQVVPRAGGEAADLLGQHAHAGLH